MMSRFWVVNHWKMFLHFLLSRRPMTLIDTALSDAIIGVLEEGMSDAPNTHHSYPYLSSSLSS